MSDKYIQVALNEAKKSQMLHKHGCVIVYRGEIISKAFNQKVSFYHHKQSIHAEISAIMKTKKLKKKLNFSYSDCEMYVVQLSTDENYNFFLSKPCKNCTKSIQEYNIGKVYYSLRK
jgi:deoxycytidylate deaminase